MSDGTRTRDHLDHGLSSHYRVCIPVTTPARRIVAARATPRGRRRPAARAAIDRDGAAAAIGRASSTRASSGRAAVAGSSVPRRARTPGATSTSRPSVKAWVTSPRRASLIHSGRTIGVPSRGLALEPLAVGGERAEDPRPARELAGDLGARVGLHVELRAVALVGAEHGAAEGVHLRPALEQLGAALDGRVDERRVAAGVGVVEREARHAAGQHPGERRAHAVALAPVHGLVAHPEQPRRARARGERRAVEVDDVGQVRAARSPGPPTSGRGSGCARSRPDAPLAKRPANGVCSAKSAIQPLAPNLTAMSRSTPRVHARAGGEVRSISAAVKPPWSTM